MALAQKTNILLLDEPTTYLDISHLLEVMELLRTINQHNDLTGYTTYNKLPTIAII